MFSLLLFYFEFVYTQNINLSTDFLTEIKGCCLICNNTDCEFFYQSDIDFHSVHELIVKNNIDEAFIKCTKLIESKRLSDTSIRFFSYALRGTILREKKIYNSAISDLNNAIALGEDFNNNEMGNLYTKLGELYLETKKFKKGVEILERWKKRYISSGEPKDFDNANINLHNLGLCYLHLSDYKSAKKNLFKSYLLNVQTKDTLGLARSSLDIANLYYVQYMDEQAIRYFEKGLDYANRANDLELIKNANLNLAIVEENRNDYAQALIYRKKYEKIKDSIWNRDKIWELSQKDKEIAVALKEKEIDKLELTSSLQDATISKERIRSKWYLSLAISFIGISSLIGLFLYRFRVKNRIIFFQKEDLKQLNETKDRLFSILTHDLKTPITVIKDILHDLIESNNIDKQLSIEDLKNSYKLSKKTSLLIDNTLHWILESKNSLMFKKEQLHLKSILDQVIYDYLPILNIKEIYFSAEIDNKAFILADANTLKVVLRNILDNAIKFSYPKGKIILTTIKNEQSWSIHLKDFGTGFDPSQLHISNNQISDHTSNLNSRRSTGLGLKLCKDFIKRNHGFFYIHSTPGIGTEVCLTLSPA